MLGFRFAAVAARAIPVEGGSKKGIGHCRGLRCFLLAKLLKASFQRLSIKKAPQLSLRCHFFERNTGFGPATSGLGSARSTN